MEKFFLKLLKLTLFLFILSSCAEEVQDEIYGIDSNTQVAGTFSQADNAKITASGTAARVRFINTLSVASSRSFRLKATLDQSTTNSAVAVILYSSDANVALGNGIIVKFSRNGSNVECTVSVNSTTRTVSSNRLLNYYPASLDVTIDVHNVNGQARVVVWRTDSSISYSSSNTDIDSNRSGDLSGSLAGLTGAGIYAGLEITNATVFAASVGDQKLQD